MIIAYWNRIRICFQTNPFHLAIGYWQFLIEIESESVSWQSLPHSSLVIGYSLFKPIRTYFLTYFLLGYWLLAIPYWNRIRICFLTYFQLGYWLLVIPYWNRIRICFQTNPFHLAIGYWLFLIQTNQNLFLDILSTWLLVIPYWNRIGICFLTSLPHSLLVIPYSNQSESISWQTFYLAMGYWLFLIEIESESVSRQSLPHSLLVIPYSNQSESVSWQTFYLVIGYWLFLIEIESESVSRQILFTWLLGIGYSLLK